MKPAAESTVVEADQCPLCSQPNRCQLCTTAAYKGPCWCATTNIPDELLARLPVELRNKACICRECVTAFQIDTLRILQSKKEACEQPPSSRPSLSGEGESFAAALVSRPAFT